MTKFRLLMGIRPDKLYKNLLAIGVPKINKHFEITNLFKNLYTNKEIIYLHDDSNPKSSLRSNRYRSKSPPLPINRPLDYQNNV